MTRLGICVAGLNGAVASTMIAGVALMRRSRARPVSMISEPFKESHQLAGLDSLVFGGWDVREENLFQSAVRNGVLDAPRIQPLARELAALKPWPASPRSLARQIDRFRAKHKLDATVVLNLLPTGIQRQSRRFARAAAETGSPFINFTPNDSGETALTGIPYCGKDGKTGQTWLKTVLAPAFRARELRITGWYSTNLLGNEDGRVVGDARRGKAKIEAKTRPLAQMLGYGPHHHVQINFYPPRGDNKESWDAIDFEGFLGMPMQLKLNGLWRDSILAAPMCIDLVRFMELALRRGECGPQTWLSMFFKSPHGKAPQDFSMQERLLRDYLRHG